MRLSFDDDDERVANAMHGNHGGPGAAGGATNATPAGHGAMGGPGNPGAPGGPGFFAGAGGQGHGAPSAAPRAFGMPPGPEPTFGTAGWPTSAQKGAFDTPAGHGTPGTPGYPATRPGSGGQPGQDTALLRGSPACPGGLRRHGCRHHASRDRWVRLGVRGRVSRPRAASAATGACGMPDASGAAGSAAGGATHTPPAPTAARVQPPRSTRPLGTAWRAVEGGAATGRPRRRRQQTPAGRLTGPGGPSGPTQRPAAAPERTRARAAGQGMARSLTRIVSASSRRPRRQGEDGPARAATGGRAHSGSAS